MQRLAAQAKGRGSAQAIEVEFDVTADIALQKVAAEI